MDTTIEAPPTNVRTLTLLAPIGAPREGGIYAGIGRDVGTNTMHHLIVLDEAPKKLSWRAAMDWAKSIGAELMSQADMNLCFANVRDHFKPEWYWSSTPYAGDERFAWLQNFNDGCQSCNRKDGTIRARAVRRLPIQ